MTTREKVLAGSIVGLLAIWGLWRGYTAYEDGYDSRVRELARLDNDLFDEQLEGKKGRRALRRLERYQRQSLPTDPEAAQSEYRAWLIDAVKTSGLTLTNVKSEASRRRVGEAADALAFDLTASGPPGAIARLLDAYYRLDTLHKLTTLTLTPVDGRGAEWNVTLRSTALLVDGAASVSLPAEPREPSRLARESADDYAEGFASRNLFARYTPPPPPRRDPPKVVKKDPPPKPPKPSPPPFDDAEHAQLTGVVETGVGFQAWVHVRTTGETLHLRQGDAFEVGLMKGRVLAVSRRELLLELEGGEAWRVALGEKLRDGEATELPSVLSADSGRAI